MGITVKQTQKTSVKARRNGFYLVKLDNKTIGSFEKLWYTSNPTYQVIANIAGVLNNTMYSTKQKAIDAIVNRHTAKPATKRPLVNPHAGALKQDKQLRAQQKWDKNHKS